MTAYVVPSEWVDEEYRGLQQAALKRSLTPEEMRALCAGRRHHPFKGKVEYRVEEGELRAYGEP